MKNYIAVYGLILYNKLVTSKYHKYNIVYDYDTNILESFSEKYTKLENRN